MNLKPCPFVPTPEMLEAARQYQHKEYVHDDNPDKFYWGVWQAMWKASPDGQKAGNRRAVELELLEALTELLDALPSATTHPAIRKARAAIAKAGGGE